ncbi:hypothetical protein HGP14_28790 [Rhizobium sp. P32RR-XVIII]|uniref:hypothetical protein n=1 Tax=Rhizobium sp. P32RR-XVIII TaxID=2726738 RepID=UPI001456A5B2|nr:hypothetical protein [Rhizobium sp. P32RR-XVIII]NLS07287.1 hypothetical protein [Rhizobium sp. P32RR-XVIII]
MIVLIVAVVIVVVFFFLFPRPTLIAITALGAVGIGIATFIYFQQSSRDGSITSIKGTSSGADGCVDPAKPVFVRLLNGSKQQVDVVRFQLIAKRRGFSVEYYSDYLTSYKIIAPGGTYDDCWALNQYRGLQTLPEKLTPQELDWSVEISSVEFASDR